MQIISTDNFLRSDTVQDPKEFNSQSLTTQAKKGEKFISMMPATKEAFHLMSNDIVELHTENETLKKQIGDYDEKWLQKSRTKLLKQIDDEKRAKLIMSRKKKQMIKQH